jgi:hypothetical protein
MMWVVSVGFAVIFVASALALGEPPLAVVLGTLLLVGVANLVMTILLRGKTPVSESASGRSFGLLIVGETEAISSTGMKPETTLIGRWPKPVLGLSTQHQE